jgi:predicted RNase H-like HicB family nuclease
MKVPEGYIAFVEELPGANTQGGTLQEARENLEEAVAMVLDANRALSAQSLRGAEVIRETLVLPAAAAIPSGATAGKTALTRASNPLPRRFLHHR